MLKVSPFLAAGVLGLIALPGPARAIDLHLRVEPGVAFAATAPQSRLFEVGGGGGIKAGLTVVDHLDLELSGLYVALPGVDAPGQQVADAGTALSFGGGVRFNVFRRAGEISPWLDADALYVRTGSLDRFGFSVGAGFSLPLGAARSVWLGPFVRYFQIIEPDNPGVDTSDAQILLVGLSAELATPHPLNLDHDGDGIADKRDRCPDQPGPIENGGCPDTDSDGDGIIDRRDHCPNEAGPRENAGCPDRDRDADGVIDRLDRCPDRAGPKENQGCPFPDRDKDGVVDKDDRCPDQPGPRENQGCPDTDKDGDGVVDRLDRCPDVPGPADNQGCPKPKHIIVTKDKIELREKVHFATNKATIFEDSNAMLNEIVDVLKQRPDVKVRIEGHTDSRGKLDHNMTLSDARANAVRTYLIGHGVSPERLEAKGFGPTQPIGDNRTDSGREQNRRVEFIITSQDTEPKEEIVPGETAPRTPETTPKKESTP